MPEISSTSASPLFSHWPSQPASAQPAPPVGPRTPTAILAEVDGWVGMRPFKNVMHRLARAGHAQHPIPNGDSAAYNLMLQGGSGVGKTQAARRYGELLHSLGLSNGNLVRWSGTGPGDLAEMAGRVCGAAAGGVLIIDDAHGFSEKFSRLHTLDAVSSALKHMAHPPVVILCGEFDSQKLLERHAGLRRLFAQPNAVTLQAWTPHQTVKVLEGDASVRGYCIDPRAAQTLREALPPSNAHEKQLLLDYAIVEHASRRGVRASPVLDAADFAGALKAPAPKRPKKSVTLPPPTRAEVQRELDDLMKGMIRAVASPPPPPPRVQGAKAPLPASASACKALAKVEALEGLEHVKQAMRDVYANAVVSEARSKRGLFVEPPVLHAAFTGNPGTGKTTVARLYGELLCELGLLGATADGKVHEVDRSGLVGKYIGQTESLVSALLQKAKGGVLFIDEAHGLVPTSGDDDKDFGRLALDLIVKFMEDRRHEIAIVFAGYADPMERLHHANPGLRSRLGQQLSFPDFDAPALVRILQKELERRDYTLDAAAAKRICTKLIDLGKRDETFANARSVRQVIDNAITVQSQRLSGTLDAHTSREAMMQLVEADFFARDDGKPAKRDEPWRSMYI